jgi:outer membrane immunogenic protein
MRKTLMLSSAMFIAAMSTASAADLPVYTKAPPPVLPPVFSWTGFYLGAGVGFRSSQSNADVTGLTNRADTLDTVCAFLTGGCVTSEPLNATVFRISPYFGYNQQVAPLWIVGVEADVGFADKTTTLKSMFYPVTLGITPTAADQFSVGTGRDASVRARAGYLVTPGIMAYATVGPTWLRAEATSNCSSNPLLGLCDPNFSFRYGAPVITDVTTKLGWTAGVGLEAALGSNWVARGEYRYSDYGTITNTDVRTGPNNPLTVTYDLSIKTHTATLGLAYKFGEPIEPVGFPAGPYKATPVAAPTWTGAHVGAGLGIRSTVTNAQVIAALNAGNSLASMCSSLAAGGGCTINEPIDDTAFRFSPYAGFNWQFAPRWITGIEADVGLADRTTTLNGMFLPFNSTGISGLAEDTFSVKTTWDASLRGRIGFSPAPWLMAYATGGPAWLHVTATSTCNTVEAGRCAPGSFSPSVISDSTTKFGWTVGAGLEAQLRSNWIARAEYRYSDFGTITNTDVRQNGGGALPFPLPLIVTYDLTIRTHTMTLGVAYKFD